MYSDDDDPDYMDGNPEYGAGDDLRDMWSEAESEGEEQLGEEYMLDVENHERVTKKSVKQKVKAKGRNSVAEKPLSPEVESHIAAAIAYFADEKHDAAIEEAERAIALDPQAKRAYEILAVSYADKQELEKVLMAKITIAHLDKKNKQGWIEVADMSRDLELDDQALRFYQVAGSLDDQPDEYIMRERAEIYEKLGRYGRALELWRKLRRIDKTNPELLVRITQNLVAMKRVLEAISLYEDLLQKNLDAEGSEDIQEFGLSELNILAELYFKQNSFQKAITVIKRTVRHLNGRDDDWWDNYKDDTEYFPYQRDKVVKYQTGPYVGRDELYDMALDLRVKLLMCRAKMDDIEESKEHLPFLLNSLVEDYEDLFREAAKVYLDVGEAGTALELLEKRHEAMGKEDPGLLATPLMAKCYEEIGDTMKAEACYDKILSEDQDLTPEKLYEISKFFENANKSHKAQRVLDRASEIVEERKEKSVASNRQDGAFIEAKQKKPRKSDQPSRYPTKRLTRHERELEEKRLEQEAKEKLSSYRRLQEQFNAGDLSVRPQLRRRLTELYNIFSDHRKFFNKDKTRLYLGETVLRGRRRGRLPNVDIEEKIKRMASRLQDSKLDDADELLEENDEAAEEAEKKSPPSSFRDISFEDWFELCMLHILTETQAGSVDVALAGIEKMSSANVFHQHEWRREMMIRVYICTAFHAQDYEIADQELRHILHANQLKGDTFKLYGSIFPSGHAANECYSNNKNQKYFMRQIKAIDAMVNKKEVAGAARILNDKIELKDENPILLTMYAHIMLNGRSYVPALGYLNRAMNIKPKDTMILLSVGLVHIHRALQRQTTNRHLQIMEGLSFMCEYHEGRSKQGPGGTQEANFNMARVFHMLGLPSLAIKYYERVLEANVPQKEYDLAPNAAYNLHLIYAMSGNGKLARHYVDKYIVI